MTLLGRLKYNPVLSTASLTLVKIWQESICHVGISIFDTHEEESRNSFRLGSDLMLQWEWPIQLPARIFHPLSPLADRRPCQYILMRRSKSDIPKPPHMPLATPSLPWKEVGQSKALKNGSGKVRLQLERVGQIIPARPGETKTYLSCSLLKQQHLLLIKSF